MGAREKATREGRTTGRSRRARHRGRVTYGPAHCFEQPGRYPARPYDGAVERSGRRDWLTKLIRGAVSGLLDQSQPFGRLALTHTVFSGGSTLVTISLAGSLFFSISPDAAKSKVLLYLVLTIAPFAIVAPTLSPLLDRGSHARRTSIAVAAGGSAALTFLMARDLKGLLLFPEAFGVLVLSKLYLIAKAALVPSMTESAADLASANAKLAVLASLAGFVVAPVGVGLLQLGAPWVLRVAFFVFLGGAASAVRLPRVGADMTARASPIRGQATVEPGPPALTYGPPAPGTGTHAPGTGTHAPGARTPGGGSRSRARGAPDRSRRIDAARERQRLGLPLYVPEVMLGLTAMSVIRGAVGFLTFFLAFALRHLHAATWWYGLILLASAVGSLAGSLAVPRLRRTLSEQQLILWSLVLSALVGGLTAISGSLWVQPVIAAAIGFATTAAKPAFDSIVQRHVAPALLGRAFARFETRLQLVWVLAALFAVVVGVPLDSGDLLVGVACAIAAAFHVAMRRSVGRHLGDPALGAPRRRSGLRPHPGRPTVS